MPPQRRGYTLFEMVIVLALIVLLAGLAIPAIESMYADYKLQSAVDQVSGKWSQMRTRAILEGRSYRFGVGANGSDFRVAPDDGQYWSGGDPPAQSDSQTPPLVVEDSLPRGIQFTQADSTAANPYDALKPAPSASSGAWNTVAVFLPDGTAQQDVEIVFRMPNCAPLALKLRALTGGVSSRRLPADGPGCVRSPMIASLITSPRRAGGVSPLIVPTIAAPSIKGLTPPARLVPFVAEHSIRGLTSPARLALGRPALTLLEVLIALAIFLMAMVVFGEMIVRNGRFARDVQRQNLATRLCKSKLQEVMSGAVPLTSQGDEAFDEEPNYTWSLQADSGVVDGLWNVTVTVTYTQAGADDPIQCSVTQMVLDPSIEGSTQDATPVSTSPTNTNSGTSGNSTGGSGTGGSGTGSSTGSSTPSAGGASSSMPSGASSSKSSMGNSPTPAPTPSPTPSKSSMGK